MGSEICIRDRNYLPHSKHLHVITSIPNVYFSNLGTVNKLEKIDFEQVGLEKFGKGDIEDFTWKQLLDGMTCTHCGRCSTVCPANSTGKILDPKEIIIGLNNRTMDKAPQVLRSKGVQDIPGAVSYTHLRAHETVLDLVCRLLLEKKTHNKQKKKRRNNQPQLHRTSE